MTKTTTVQLTLKQLEDLSFDNLIGDEICIVCNQPTDRAEFLHYTWCWIGNAIKELKPEALVDTPEKCICSPKPTTFHPHRMCGATFHIPPVK